MGFLFVPSFELGVLALPNGELLPVKWVDLQLYQHGEGGNAPRDYAFRFKAGDQVYTVQVRTDSYHKQTATRLIAYVVGSRVNKQNKTREI